MLPDQETGYGNLNSLKEIILYVTAMDRISTTECFQITRCTDIRGKNTQIPGTFFVD